MGGLIGVLGFPDLMDGGTVTTPNVRIFSLSGEWIAENTGVAPDIEVELIPSLLPAGTIRNSNVRSPFRWSSLRKTIISTRRAQRVPKQAERRSD
jgi:hypothetical protein